MKLGIGLYRHQLDAEHLRFARQCGCTHIVAHLVDYFGATTRTDGTGQPVGEKGGGGWGVAGNPDRPWTYQELAALKTAVNDAGLELEAIENFDPAHWYDVLLGGPKRDTQLEGIKQLIRDVGKAGIRVFGYNFSIAGVAGRIHGKFARGEAESVGMDGPVDDPMPRGMVWNMVYDPKAGGGTVPSATSEELWARLKVFLDAVLPVAEEAGVTLAAHPDDPPMPTVRRQPRLVYQPHLYQKLIDLRPSPRNALEFCVGTVAEMTEGDVYQATDRYGAQGKLAYVHLRNVTGKVPYYRETFVDDGDVDMIRVIRILRKNDYQGVIVPDHTPQMACAAPWHAGMAYALGFIRAAIRLAEEEHGQHV